MSILNQVTTQTKRVTLMSLINPVAYRVRVEDYNDETNKFELSESYGSPHLIDCQINFQLETYSL